ncbi:hypothetical protein Dimus_027725 [Dionaea muscipula]
MKSSTEEKQKLRKALALSMMFDDGWLWLWLWLWLGGMLAFTVVVSVPLPPPTAEICTKQIMQQDKDAVQILHLLEELEADQAAY